MGSRDRPVIQRELRRRPPNERDTSCASDRAVIDRNEGEVEGLERGPRHGEPWVGRRSDESSASTCGGGALPTPKNGKLCTDGVGPRGRGRRRRAPWPRQRRRRGNSRLRLTAGRPQSESVPVRIVEPRRPRRPKLRDVPGRLQRPLRVVDEADAVTLQLTNHRLDVGHLEVGEGVVCGALPATEDRKFGPSATTETHRRGIVPEEGEPQGLPVKAPRVARKRRPGLR